MKRKLLLMLMLCALTTLVACGKDEEKETVELGSIIIEEETLSTEPSKEEITTDSEIKETVEETTEKENVITTVKEEDAVIDFNGVKLPVTITWEEFKVVMTENNWTFKDSEDNFPGKRLSGNGYIYTNCGPVRFYFSENEAQTESVLMKVVIYKDDVTSPINISGISYNISKELLSSYITPIDDDYYLDEYLSVKINEDQNSFSIKRTFFHKR
jgi:major membrane immunogen (membrane-anchored lipoprotein)